MNASRSIRMVRLFAVAALATAAQLAWAHPTYTLEATSLDSIDQSPAGLNRRGWVAQNDHLSDESFRCTRSACMRIPPLPNATGIDEWVKAKAIDERGVVVGEASFGRVSHAFSFDGNTMQDLGALGDDLYSAAYASNKRGQIVGTVEDTRRKYQAVVWSGGTMTLLPTLGGDEGGAFAINEAGVIAGSAMTPDGAYHAAVFRDGQVEDLGILPGGSIASALAINRHGQVVGESSTDGMFKRRAFIHDNGQLREMPALPNTVDSSASSINDAGWAVGSALVHGRGSRGFAFDGTTTFDLNDALSPADRKRWKIESAVSINAKGQILVGARDKTQWAYRVMVMTPQ